MNYLNGVNCILIFKITTGTVDKTLVFTMEVWSKYHYGYPRFVEISYMSQSETEFLFDIINQTTVLYQKRMSNELSWEKFIYESLKFHLFVIEQKHHVKFFVPKNLTIYIHNEVILLIKNFSEN